MADADPIVFGHALATELHDVRRVLEEIAVELCLDPIVFERHAESLQAFDRLAQIIGEVATIMQHDGPQAGAMAGIRLDELRERLLQSCGSLSG